MGCGIIFVCPWLLICVFTLHTQARKRRISFVTPKGFVVEVRKRGMQVKSDKARRLMLGSHSLDPEIWAQKKEELVLSGAVDNTRQVGNALMEMLAESGRTMRNSPGGKGEKATQAKGKGGTDKSTGMKMSFKVFPVCFAVLLCAFCRSCGTLSAPSRKQTSVQK